MSLFETIRRNFQDIWNLKKLHFIQIIPVLPEFQTKDWKYFWVQGLFFGVKFLFRVQNFLKW